MALLASAAHGFSPQSVASPRSSNGKLKLWHVHGIDLLVDLLFWVAANGCVRSALYRYDLLLSIGDCKGFTVVHDQRKPIASESILASLHKPSLLGATRDAPLDHFQSPGTEWLP